MKLRYVCRSNLTLSVLIYIMNSENEEKHSWYSFMEWGMCAGELGLVIVSRYRTSIASERELTLSGSNLY
jgi:hypothetical protein